MTITSRPRNLALNDDAYACATFPQLPRRNFFNLFLSSIHISGGKAATVAWSFKFRQWGPDPTRIAWIDSGWWQAIYLRRAGRNRRDSNSEISALSS